MPKQRAILRTLLITFVAALASGCGRSEPPEARLSGTVLYRERMALAPGATIRVRLEDVSRADVAADVVAEQTIAANGRQVPIPFELRYAASGIEANHRYGLRAEIRAADGQLMFATTMHQAVLADGAPTKNVVIVVQRTSGGSGGSARAEPPTDAVPPGSWRLVAIQRPGAAEQAIGPEPSYTIEFGVDGRFSGQAHCNRFTGGYRQPGPGQLTIAGAAATLAACLAPSIADEYLRAVGTVTRYELRGERLRLSYGEDSALIFARDAVPGPAAAVPPATPPAAASAVGRTFVFDCDGGASFTIRTGPGEVALWAPQPLGGGYHVLSQTRTASGARYEEGDSVFWSKGDVAMFEYAGRTFMDCQSNPRKVPWADAARRGVTFRALGNEPSWSLEIMPERLAMITDLGARRTELAIAAPAVAASKMTYRAAADGHDLVAVVDRTGCTDSMSGEAFEASATVTFDGTMYYGCGRFL